jgi:hypothetical protein
MEELASAHSMHGNGAGEDTFIEVEKSFILCNLQ